MIVRDAGWSTARLDALVGLNSFYHIVLAPLASWARDHFPVGLAQEFPIRYGTRLSFDAESAYLTRRMMGEFRAAIADLDVPLSALEANQADEMLLAVTPHEFG